MNKKKIINYIIIGLSIISFIVLLLLINKIGVIPNKYLKLYYIVEIIFILLSIGFSFYKKKVFYVLSLVFSIILIFLNSFGYYYIKHLDKFIDKGFTGDIVDTTVYYLVTSSSNGINNVNEITLDIPIYYYAYSRHNEEMFKVFGNYDYKGVEDINTYLIDNINSNSYLLVDDINYSLSFELNPELDESNYKIIYKFDVVTSEQRTTEVKEVFNVLITGKDFSDERNDLNMLVTINTLTHKILITSIPRDFYIPVSGSDKKDTLMVMGYYGDDVVAKSIGDFFGITVDYRINLYARNLVDIVDKVGGIEFCSSQSFYTNHALVVDTYNDRLGKKFYVKKGCQQLNGIQTLTVARERVAFKGEGDLKRQDNCRQIMLKIANKVLSMSTLANYTSVLDSFSNLYSTNINRNTAVNFIKSILSNKYTTFEQSVKGSSSNARLRMNTLYGYVMIPNSSTVDAASNKMKEIINEK